MASVPECVAIRHRGAFDFETHYCSLCALQDTVPLLEVKAHLVQGILDINADKIRLADWTPILNTLRINKNLRFIAIRSYYAQSVAKDDGKKSHYFKRRTPAIQDKDLTLRLAQTLSECLKQTESLKCLDLQGVPFRQKDLGVISKGLERNTTLTHVSMEYCHIRDEGCERITTVMKHHPSLTHLNFTGCSLTRNSAEVVSKLIKHQSTERHSEAWADSLRYRQPNLNNMTGLRRITLNHNPMLGDEGICLIADALKDDLWLKAIDLQKCGVGRDGANALLDTLTQNKTLLVVDVRFNPLIDRNLLHSVIGQVLINSNGYDDKEFPWIKSEPPKDPYRTRPRRRYKQIGSVYGRKALVRSFSKTTRVQSSPSHAHPGSEGFVPWRTAYRASQYKKTYTDGETLGTPRYLQNPENCQVHVHTGEESATSSDEEEPIKASDLTSPGKSFRGGSQSLKKQSSESVPKAIKDLEVELVQAHRTIAEQRNARRLAEQRATNLEIENIRLKRELEDMNEASQIRSALDDDALLDKIEASFNKFHDFLDLLDKLGLGGLSAYAGVTNIDFPLPGNNTSKRLPESDMRAKVHDRSAEPSQEQRPMKSSTHSNRRKKQRALSESDREDDAAVVPPPITIENQSSVVETEDRRPLDSRKSKVHNVRMDAGDANPSASERKFKESMPSEGAS